MLRFAKPVQELGSWDHVNMLLDEVEESDGVALVSFADTLFYITGGDEGEFVTLDFVEATDQPGGLRYHLSVHSSVSEEDFVLRDVTLPAELEIHLSA